MVREYGAGVEPRSGNGDGGVAGAEVDFRELVTHFVGLVTDGLGVSLAELAELVVSPALHAAIVEQGAGVERSSGHGQGGAAGAEVDRWEIVPHLARFVPYVLLAALAQATHFAASPALQGAVVEHGACSSFLAVDEHRGAAGAEVDGGETVTELSGDLPPPVGVAQPEFAPLVLAPALERMVVEDDACVSAPGADRDGGVPGAEVYGWEVVSHLSGLHADAGEAVVPQSPGSSQAPAAHGQRGVDRAGEGRTGGDGPGRRGGVDRGHYRRVGSDSGPGRRHQHRGDEEYGRQEGQASAGCVRRPARRLSPHD